MNWDALATQAVIVAGSGGVSFFGAFFRFKQRIRDIERELAELLKEVPELRDRLAQFATAQQQLSAGLRLDFDSLRDDLEREARHRRELDQVRASRPDPTEDLRRELAQMRQDIEKLKERATRYVRNDAFTVFTRAQEDQWKEMQRTLGRLEGMLKE